MKETQTQRKRGSDSAISSLLVRSKCALVWIDIHNVSTIAMSTRPKVSDSQDWQGLPRVQVQMLTVCAESLSDSSLLLMTAAWDDSPQRPAHLPPCSATYNKHAECLNHHSIAVKRHHDQGNFYVKKAFSWGLAYSFSILTHTSEHSMCLLFVWHV